MNNTLKLIGKNLASMGIAASVIILVGALIFGGFWVKRWFNYEFGYQAAVKTEICNMVKPEYLINPKDCE